MPEVWYFIALRMDILIPLPYTKGQVKNLMVVIDYFN